MNLKIVIGAIALVVVVGGAVWWGTNGKSASVPTVGTEQTQGTNTTASSTATDSTHTYTLADVSAHNSAASCWSAINNKVYDLTSWINQHPGGPDKILAICGIDGSSAFNGQHGGQSRPANELAGFYIGDLASQ